MLRLNWSILPKYLAKWQRTNEVTAHWSQNGEDGYFGLLKCEPYNHWVMVPTPTELSSVQVRQDDEGEGTSLLLL
jgi:hypothetical protein